MQGSSGVGLEAPVFQPRQHCRRLQVRVSRQDASRGGSPLPPRRMGEHRPEHRAWTQVLAQRKVKKTQQVILKEDVPNIGKKGELTNVINGYWCVGRSSLSKCSMQEPTKQADQLTSKSRPAHAGGVIKLPPLGRRRNYLRPKGMAVPATEGILRCDQHNPRALPRC